MLLRSLQVSQLLKPFSSTMGTSRHCGRRLGSALGMPVASRHDQPSPATYLDAASSSYLQRSSSNSVWVAFSAGKRKRRVSHRVGFWPLRGQRPLPQPPYLRGAL